MTDPVRVAFVGAGDRSVREMMDLCRMDDVEVTGLCDVDVDRCDQAIRQINEHHLPAGSAPIRPRTFARVEEMLAAVPCDAVYVSLPPFAHGQLEHTLIDAGKALLVEKPLALSRGVAREIAAHIRERDTICLVGYQWRYGETIQRARDLLAGRPIGLVLCARWGRLPSTPWWRVQRLSGGMLVEQHTHSVDIMRYCCGEVDEVYAAASTALLGDVPNLDIADVNAVTLRFAGGAVGTITNTCAAPHCLPAFRASVHVVARGLTAAIGLGTVAIFHEDGRTEEFTEEGDPNMAMNRAFVQAVRTGARDQLRSTYDDALCTFELTLAAQRSAELRQPLRVDDDWT